MTAFIPEFVETRKSIAEAKNKKFRLQRPPAQLIPKAIERQYRSDLLKILKQLRVSVEKQLILELPRIVRAADLRSDHADIEDISAMIDRIWSPIVAFLNNTILRRAESLATKYFNRTNDFNKRQIIRQLRSVLGVDAFPSEPQVQNIMNSFIRENVGLIKGLTTNQLQSIEIIVYSGVKFGDRPASIAADIRKQFRISKSRAALIARDQTNKLNGALTRMRQTNLGIDEYIWRTSRDERVRESHLVKEGEKFRWDSPPPDTGHPGQDINCRCTAEPVIEGVPPKQEDRRKVIREVREQRASLRKQIKGAKSSRLIARDK